MEDSDSVRQLISGKNFNDAELSVRIGAHQSVLYMYFVSGYHGLVAQNDDIASDLNRAEAAGAPDGHRDGRFAGGRDGGVFGR